MNQHPRIHTIGHSNLTLAEFVARLRSAAIDTVVDVRSQPSSRYSPHFNRRTLAQSLRDEGIRYSFMGDCLGGRPESTLYYDTDGHVRYDRWAESPEFRGGIVRLTRAVAKYHLAIMCSEADPLRCHRHLLIARVLVDGGWPAEAVLHIVGAGKLRPYAPAVAQGSLLGDDGAWRSPQSALHKVQPNTSLSA